MSSRQVNVERINSRPPVDIIIPFHGQYDSLLKTLAAVQDYTPNQKYTIYLVDDASPNRTFISDLMTGRKKTVAVQMDEQVGFGGAVSKGVFEGKSPHVVVMHSDVAPLSINWLIEMQRVLSAHRDQGVKLVSARVTDPGTANDYPSGWVARGEEPDVDFIEADRPVPFTCVLFHRELFNRLGGLRPYPFGWYEDVEFAYRMKKAGFQQGIAVKSVVHHAGGKTINPLLTTGKVNAQMMENAARCRRHLAV